METFTLSDLKYHSETVVDAAIRAPVRLTGHGAAALVILSQDEYDRRLSAADPRRAYDLKSLPQELAQDIATSLRAVDADSYG
jgi:PHD/YefM family antitoxin component YafN of YafNO toxin-antitoxin module